MTPPSTNGQPDRRRSHRPLLGERVRPGAGWKVVLWAPPPDVRATAADLVARSLEDLASPGLVTDAAAAAKRVRVVASLEEAVADVDFVQESGPETPEAKRDIFARLNAAATRDVVLVDVGDRRVGVHGRP